MLDDKSINSHLNLLVFWCAGFTGILLELVGWFIGYYEELVF